MLMDTRPQSDHGYVMKDRLAELLAISRDIVDDVTSTMAPSVYMKEFFIKVKEVRGIIEKISSQVDEVERSQSAILSAPIPDQRTKAELEQLNNDIKKNASTVQAKLKSMHESMLMDESGNNTSADQRIQKNQHSDLTRSFVEVMTVYNKAQITFREKCKARIQRQLEITGKITTDEELEELLHSGNPAIFTADMVSDSQTTRQALSEIESRHQDIILLENSIRELREMFVDIALLVETQGDTINNIEKNVSTAVDYVDQAKGQTKKAVVYQKRARRKHVIIALVVVVLLAVIALAVGLSVGLPKA